MYGYRRARLDLDADVHECFRYFALIRGVPVGGALRQVITQHAQQVEKEFLPIRAHMLAWRSAMAAAQKDATPEQKAEAANLALEEIPF